MGRSERSGGRPLGKLASDQEAALLALHFSIPSSLGVGEAARIELAKLAGFGYPGPLAQAMERDPSADPSLAVVWAAKNGRLDCLPMLLARFDAGSFHGEAACEAAKAGNAQCLALLAGAAPAEDLDEMLAWAASGGSLACCESLMALGARPSEPPSADGVSALRAAARVGAAECCQALLDAGAKPPGALDFLAAAQSGSAEAVRVLARAGGDPARGSRALERAVELEDLEVVRELLPASRPKDESSKCLRMAVEQGWVEGALLLIPASDVDARDFEGRAGLHLAAILEFDDDDPAAAEEVACKIAGALLAAGAQLALDDCGRSPEDWARSNGRMEMAAMLAVEGERRSIAQCIGSGSAAPPFKPRL